MIKKNIIFRNENKDIPTTTYGAFSIYKYPAKFIPQIISFILKNYGRENMTVFDPFAGSGTVGLVSRIYGFDYEMWDLNPMLDVIHKAAIKKTLNVNIPQIINDIHNCRQQFIPDWSNLNYWFPEEFLEQIFKTWGYVHSLDDELKYILLIPLLKTTRYFSFSDEKTHKLYSSKFAKAKIDNLLKNNWQHSFFNMFVDQINKFLFKRLQYSKLYPQDVASKIISGNDIYKNSLKSNIDILITSPPYLQAQEYIRSTKMELYFLGCKENYIKKLSKHEIPYCSVPNIEIQSKTYFDYLENINESHLRKLYQRYFNAILGRFQELSDKINEYMFIFVGPAKIRTTPIPLDNIILEHLENVGWKHEITYIDKIISRVLFRSKINPASKNKDERIKTEHLIVLRRK